MKKTLLFFFGASVLLSACRDFLDVNESPNNPADVPVSAILPSAQVGAAFANSNEVNRFASVVMQQMAGNAGNPGTYGRYNAQGVNLNNQWNFELYGGVLINSQEMIRRADELNSPVYSGIGKLLKAYGFSLATDIWGDIPYSQALQGDNILQPRFDAQEDIYLGNEALGIQSLFDLVKEGLADLDRESVARPLNDDLIYGGDLTKWRRMGNSLLIKFAIVISNRASGRTTEEIAEVLNVGDIYINNNDANFQLIFGDVTGQFNPIHSWTNVSLFRDEMMGSTRFVERLQALNDPRLPRYYTRPSGNFVTIEDGFNGTPPPPATRSRFGPYVTGTNGQGPIRMITYAQTCFDLAEAALRFGVTQGKSAQEYYVEGIEASMSQVGIPADSVEAYLAQPEVRDLSGSQAQQLDQILLQKYIALFGNGFESYNDWRRTRGRQDAMDNRRGFLPTPLNADPFSNAEPVPLRLPYPTDEISRNPNTPGLVTIDQPFWWAQL